MDQFAGRGLAVADGPGFRVQRREPAQLQASYDGVERRARQAEQACDARATHASAPPDLAPCPAIWFAEPGKFWAAPDNLDWVGASLALVRGFAEAGGRRAVMAGTCAEYAWGQDERLDEWTSPIEPSTLYGVSKDALRRVFLSYAKAASLSAAWGRIFFLYGPDEKPGRLVSDAIRMLSAGESFPTTEGLQRRDFLHVADVAGAFAALLASDVEGSVNIGSGEAVTVRSILEFIGQKTGGTGLIRFGERPMAVGDPKMIEANNRRLSHEVGFKPIYTLENGLAHTINSWHRS